MKIYTRAGDDGETGLFGGGRLPKDHPRVEAMGAVDELNALLGRAITSVSQAEIEERLALIQGDLFVLGSHLATAPRKDGSLPDHLPPLPRSRIEEMERWIDGATGEVPPLRNFILPGGSTAAADLHVARSGCRRAERRVVALTPSAVDPFMVRYLNRLSDLLFILARLENHRTGVEDVIWDGGGRGDGRESTGGGGTDAR